MSSSAPEGSRSRWCGAFVTDELKAAAELDFAPAGVRLSLSMALDGPPVRT